MITPFTRRKVLDFLPELPDGVFWAIWKDSPRGYEETFIRIRDHRGSTIRTLGYGCTDGDDRAVLRMVNEVAAKAGF